MKNNWKKVSIKKISEIAEVSTATVDRVLYNRGSVKKSTKKKVFKALNYLELGENNKKKNFILSIRKYL